MNLATLNINEGWPMQSQFYYNTKLNSNNYEMYPADNFSKEDHSELGNSPNIFRNTSPKEVISEAYYDANYYAVGREESNGYETKERKSRHYVTNNYKDESNFFAVDTCNSNCPINSRTTSFVTNYSHIPISNQSRHSRNSSNNENLGEKKFISELHINIKEPNTDDSDSNDNNHFQSDYDACNRSTDKPGYHLSSFETFISGQHNQLEISSKTHTMLSEIRSSSSESPNRKRECHHSEKFIYLGCDARITPQKSDDNNDVNSYQSLTLYEKGLQRPFLLNSRSSDNNDELKSFSTKSVQTSKKMDCIFKNTCDQSVETDCFTESHLKLHKDSSKMPTKKKIPPTCRTPSPRVITENASISSDNLSEVELKKYRHKHDMGNEMRKSKSRDRKLRKHSIKAFERNRYHNPEDTNQDTFPGSYSESFTQSNDLRRSPGKEKPDLANDGSMKNSLTKMERKSTTPIKNNTANMSHRLVSRNKSKKGVNERKDFMSNTDKSNESKPINISKEETDRHSLEIQCLLDNLNTHLQNTVNSHNKPTKLSMSKGQINSYTNIGSFWDNPLNPETTRSLFMGRQNTPKITEPVRQKSINPEIQAIFETLDKSHNYDKGDNCRISQKQSPNQKIHKLAMGDNHSLKMCEGLGSTDNLSDPRFPSSLKFQKSFDLSPYDELVKSHLNSSDRRIKSVAAKNGCRIVIDGPISLVDPTTTCQAIRNKIAYRCVVAGPSKDRLDKCLNYLKETFPNTCLRLHSRNNLGFKA